MTQRLFIVVALLGLALSVARQPAAADAKVSAEGREKIATDVVVGRVSELYMKTVETQRLGQGTIEVRYLYEIQIESVEKGSLRPEQVLYVRAWKVRSGGAEREKRRFSALFGHRPLPEVGDRVQAFVVHGPYELCGQTDNGYMAVYPTGLVTLDKTSK